MERMAHFSVITECFYYIQSLFCMQEKQQKSGGKPVLKLSIFKYKNKMPKIYKIKLKVFKHLHQYLDWLFRNLESVG